MEQPINLQRLSAMSIGAKIWENPLIILKLKELFPPVDRQKVPRLMDIDLPEDPEMERLLRRVQQRLEHRERLQPQHLDEIRRRQELRNHIGDRYNQLVRDGEREEFRNHLEAADRGEPFRPYKRNNDLYEVFNSILELARKYLRMIIDKVPLKLQNYCEEVIIAMGENIYHWMEYLYYNLEFNVKLPDKLYWTVYGAVDESKIFEIWESDEEFAKEKSSEFKNPLLHILACLYVQEDFIENHQGEMEQSLKTIQRLNFDLRNYDDKTYTLISLYLHFCIFPHETVKRDDMNNSGYIILPNKMLEISIEAAFNKLVYYSWGILRDFGYEEEYLIQITTDCLQKLRDCDNDNYYKKHKLGEILIFLISQMQVQQRGEFIVTNVILLFRELLPLWPFNEIIFDLVNNYFLGFAVADYQQIFQNIQGLIMSIPIGKSSELKIEFYRQVFEKILTDLSINLKRQIFSQNYIQSQFRIFDFKCLRLILNDMNVDLRAQMIQGIAPNILSLAEECNFDRLRQFEEEILTSEHERKSCKELILNSVINILKKAEFEKADQLFNYSSLTKDEKDAVKRKQNHYEVCEHFIMEEWRYDKAESYLQWVFDSEEERDLFRYFSFDDNFFIYERTSQTWDDMLNMTPSKSKTDIRSDYMKFFFGLPEEIESLKNKDEFYSFREKCGKHFIEIYGNRSYHNKEKIEKSALADIYMKWVCKDKERRDAVKMNYRNDDERRFFCDIVESLLNLAQSKAFYREVRNRMGYRTN